MKYKPVIGLEIHAELKTKTKMFCDSLNDPDEKHPNVNVCPICMGHPGTLPVANEDAVKKVIMAGLALDCQIERDTFFERKNYFYPDLPKGYQISQYQKPLCQNGVLEIPNSKFQIPNNNQIPKTKKIRITRIHLEEDAGRLYHAVKATGTIKGKGPTPLKPVEEYSLVDYNRAGMPLMELVTEPDLESGEDVKDFAEELQLILRYLGVSDADMEKGLMRVEVNISLRPQTDADLTQNNAEIQHRSASIPHSSALKLGTKVEVKNINSIKFAADAVNFEIQRQAELLEAGKKVKQETRGWDEKKRETYLMRSKEEAQDYRYFPEPDLPPLRVVSTKSQEPNSKQIPNSKFQIQNQIYLDEIKALIPELPQQRRERFAKQYGLPERYAEMFVVNRRLGDYYEHVSTELDSVAKDYHKKMSRARSTSSGQAEDEPTEPHISEKLHTLAANYIVTEFPVLMNSVGQELDMKGFKISPEAFAELMVLIFHKELSSTGAKTVLKEMAETGEHPEQIMKERDLGQVSDIGELEAIVGNVIADNSKAVDDYKKGNQASIKFLIGMVMRETKGKANPQVVEEILKKRLN